MKIACYYYSLEENCKFIADNLLKNFIDIDGIDFIPIRLRVKNEKIKPKSFSKFLWGGKSVFMKEIPELEDYKVIDDADYYIIGTPVWAWNYTPAIGKFLSDFELKNKKVAIFICHDGGPRKTIKKISDKLKNSEIISSMDFKSPIKNSATTVESVKKWSNELKKIINKK